VPNLKVDVRRHGPIAKSSGAVTTTDKFERDERPVSRSVAFWDALTRASGAISGIPTHMKAWGRWDG
jgi:hypothetical protein